MEPAFFLDGRVALYAEDCMAALDRLPDNSADAVVCDPPYGLGFMGKWWDAAEGVAFRPGLWTQVLRVLKPGGHLVAFSGTRTYHRLAVAIEDAGFEIRDQLAWVYGKGFPKAVGLKPAWEPIALARRPLSESTVAANVARWGTGALNLEGCRIATTDNLNGGAYSGARRRRDEHSSTDATDGAVHLSRFNRGIGEYKQPAGRWPANIVHDGSDEVIAQFPCRDDGGSAARFFYCAKAGREDRIGSKHPTVKPVSLMRWLVRLVAPRGGVVLDPFAGTGTTGAAAFIEGSRAVLIEREAEYCADIARRLQSIKQGELSWPVEP